MSNIQILRRLFNDYTKKYINKISKGVYELGSIFKTFTVALALDSNIVKPNTIIQNIPRSINCSNHKISDIKEFPKDLSVEDILIRSSNIGTLLIARKIGKEKFKEFIDSSQILKSPDLQLEEVGNPIDFKWNKCKLETVSFGHGITTTPLQAVTLYASLANGGNIIQPNLIKNSKKNNAEIMVDNLNFPEVLKVNSNDQTRILWMGPENWLVISSNNLLNELNEKFSTTEFAVTDISHSRSIIELQGSDVLEVIKKGSPFDIESLTKNNCTNTVYNGITITIDNIEDSKNQINST